MKKQSNAPSRESSGDKGFDKAIQQLFPKKKTNNLTQTVQEISKELYGSNFEISSHDNGRIQLKTFNEDGSESFCPVFCSDNDPLFTIKK